MSGVSNRFKILSGVSILIVIIAVVGYRFMTMGGKEPPPSITQLHATEGVPVDVAKVELRDINVTMKISGTLEGVGEANIQTNMPMRIKKIHVEPGKKVKKNQVLVTLDPLSSTSMYAGHESSKIRYKDAKRNMERMKPLFEAGAVSESDWDAVKSSVEMAKAGLTDFRHALKLRSPIAGRVTRVEFKVGDQVDSGKPIVTVATTDDLKLVAKVGQRKVSQISIGDASIIRSISFDGKEVIHEGKVSLIGLSADQASRLFRVEINFSKSDNLLKSGTLHEVEINLESASQVPTVSAVAVEYVEDKPHVFRAADGKAAFVPIQTGLKTRDWVQVTDGLSIGDEVVVNGANMLNRKKELKVKIHNRPGSAVGQ
jgi:RND family efflux transporter MFP subunit